MNKNEIDRFKEKFITQCKCKLYLTRDGLKYHGEIFQFVDAIQGEITDEYISTYIRILDEITRYTAIHEYEKYVIFFNTEIEAGYGTEEYENHCQFKIRRMNDDEVRIKVRTGYKETEIIYL